MFDFTSRYYSLETAQYTTPDGRILAFKRRRFLPRGNDLPVLQEVFVTESDRLDRITYTALGEPEQFWQICDANNTMNPPELTAEVGRVLRIPVPQV